ncbi:protein vestigial [Rhopalosiphum padi]|uniref:Vestigial n=1 Tax=Rhopalosiphum padi TaxID=40932 RepID=A0A5J6AQ55_RHOPD|nr:protein vestigial [Rhopalosiphum padi]XP_060840687.1 protein vestigial [Rhopalosiphum padi]QCR98517.1 vestigial [Rhopalosiphum padi]
MSCTEVMYQAYYPYLYQRSSGTAAPPTRAPHHHFTPFTHQYDRLRALETHQQASTSSPIGGGDSPANRWTTIADHTDSHHSSVGSGASSVGPVGGIASPASSPATANSVSVVHKEEDTSRDDARTEMDEDEDNVQDDSRTRGDRRVAAHAQYVSVNCVVFTHYTGDVATVVDEHFSRALNSDQKLNNAHQTSTKDTSPMSSRNFPASFWNSNYHSHHSTSQVYHPDTMYHHHGTAGNPADPWQTHYQQYTAAAAHHHHRAVHEYHHHHNMAAQYGSLLLPPPTSRLAPPPPPPPPPSSHPHSHQYHGKAGMEPWPNSGHHPALDTGTSYSPYPTVPGLEAQVQETSKDLYWF